MRSPFSSSIWLVTVLSLSIVFYPVGAYAERMCDNCTSEYALGDVPKSVLVRVKIIGAIKNGGIYNIPRGTDVLSLIASAGGTQPTADGEILIKRRNGKGYTLLDYSLTDLVSNEKIGIPELSAEDVILLPHSSPLIGDNTFKIISLVTGVLALVATGLLISEKVKKQ